MRAIQHSAAQRGSAEHRIETAINLRQPDAVDYWSREFGVPRAKLVEVVREVGCRVDEVRRCFAI